MKPNDNNWEGTCRRCDLPALSCLGIVLAACSLLREVHYHTESIQRIPRLLRLDSSIARLDVTDQRHCQATGQLESQKGMQYFILFPHRSEIRCA